MADVSRKRQTVNAPGFGSNVHIQDEGVARAVAQLQAAIEDLYGKFEALTATATEEVAGYDDSDVRKRLGNTRKTLEDHLASIKALERAFPIQHAQIVEDMGTYYIAQRYNPATTHAGGYVRVAKPIASPVIRMTKSETGLTDDNGDLIVWEEVAGGEGNLRIYYAETEELVREIEPTETFAFGYATAEEMLLGWEGNTWRRYNKLKVTA